MSEEKDLREAIKALALRQSALKSAGMALALAYGDPLLRFFILLEEELGLEIPETRVALGRVLQDLLQKLTYIDVILLASERIKSEDEESAKRVKEILEKLWPELKRPRKVYKCFLSFGTLAICVRVRRSYMASSLGWVF